MVSPEPREEEQEIHQQSSDADSAPHAELSGNKRFASERDTSILQDKSRSGDRATIGVEEEYAKQPANKRQALESNIVSGSAPADNEEGGNTLAGSAGEILSPGHAPLASPFASIPPQGLNQIPPQPLLTSRAGLPQSGPPILQPGGIPFAGIPPSYPVGQTATANPSGNFNLQLWQQMMMLPNTAASTQPTGIPPSLPPNMLAAYLLGASTAAAPTLPQPILQPNIDPQGFMIPPRSLGASFPAGLPPFQRQLPLPGQLPRGGPRPILYMPCDDEILSDHQILLRKQIEFFEAQPEDVETVTPGRRKGIVLGQVGIRCIHCAGIPPQRRTKGTVYYPAKYKGLYQAAQNMAASHLCEACENINPLVKEELRAYQTGKSTSGHGGKQYWSDAAKVQGIIETEEGLRFSAESRP